MKYSLKRLTLLGVLLVVGGLFGCAVGPNYKRPSVDVPVTYRNAAADASPVPQPNTGQSSAASLGDEKWWDVFQDHELQELIRTALQNNYDVRIAATRVLEARAQLGI